MTINSVAGNTITVEHITNIVDCFEYSDEQQRKGAIDKVNNNIFDQTDINDLKEIARSFSIDAD